MNTNTSSISTKMSMPVTTLASPEIIKASSREASFSSYLNGDEKTFILKLGATPSIYLPKSAGDDKEIDVFDAQKYFNDSPNRSPNLGGKSFSTRDLKKDVFPAAIKGEAPSIAALSVRSESSWNSRSSLLQTVPRSRKAKNKSFLSSIGCNCSCLTTSIINGRSKTKEKMQLQARDEAAKRRSHSPIHVKGKNNCFNMEKKLNMVTWDAITPLSTAEELKIPSISSEMHNDHDSDNSDASSDLFEIESLYIDNPFDPTTCYAPSEASIEWSVVTASAADFSLLSDSDEISSIIQTPCIKKSGLNSRTCSFKETPKIRPSILSGCKSQKSVSVAGDAHARRALAPMTRFHEESKLSFDTKKRQSSFDHRILSQPRSATSARLLYT